MRRASVHNALSLRMAMVGSGKRDVFPVSRSARKAYYTAQVEGCNILAGQGASDIIWVRRFSAGWH